jgi:methylmalonyl-CoA mutase
MSENLALAAEFPPASLEQWRKLAEAALKGADFEKRLVSKTYDGLRIEPLYARRADARSIAGRAPAMDWEIVQRIDHPDPATANAFALEDLEGGADGLALIFPGAPAARGLGVDIDTLDDLDRTLSGVMLDLASLRIETAPFDGRKIAALVAALVERRRLNPATLAIDFGLDPIGDMARSGKTSLPWPALAERAGQVAQDLAARGFGKARFLRADGRVIHDAGGSEVQELAFALATGIAYLRLLEARGLDLDTARGRISFLLAADADEFLTLAKFRAIRKLWARVEEACGLAPMPAFVAAETAWRMATARDTYVNMLRATIATFSAGLGGANAIGVLPFTLARGLPDAFARRVARNTQHVLLEESSLAKVADPAAGAGGFEDLTDKLCQAAWTLFQEIEGAGGIAAALTHGLVQRKVGAVRTAREKAVATRKDALTGTSEFPHLAEKAPDVLDMPHRTTRPAGTAKVPDNFADLVAALAGGQALSSFAPFPLTDACDRLPAFRLAEPYEALRDASDAILARTGARPRVFLANLGTPADFTARATFAKNFFEAGGIEAVDYAPASPLSLNGAGAPSSIDLNALAAAFHSSGARLACLCSADSIYASVAAPAAKALAAAGAEGLYLAGRPGDLEAPLREAGVRTFIFAGCDALAILQAAHDILRQG